MNTSWHRVRLSIVAVLLLSFSCTAGAMVFVAGKTATPVRKEETPVRPAALPKRTDLLFVDWVDTKNARLAIGGLTYGVRRDVPTIELADGSRVNDIGYLKKGTQVRIDLATDVQGARLREVHVVAATPASAPNAPNVADPRTNGGDPSALPNGSRSIGRTR